MSRRPAARTPTTRRPLSSSVVSSTTSACPLSPSSRSPPSASRLRPRPASSPPAVRPSPSTSSPSVPPPARTPSSCAVRVRVLRPVTSVVPSTALVPTPRRARRAARSRWPVVVVPRVASRSSRRTSNCALFERLDRQRNGLAGRVLRLAWRYSPSMGCTILITHGDCSNRPARGTGEPLMRAEPLCRGESG